MESAVPAWDLDAVAEKKPVHRPLSRPLFGMKGHIEFDMSVEEKRPLEQVRPSTTSPRRPHHTTSPNTATIWLPPSATMTRIDSFALLPP